MLTHLILRPLGLKLSNITFFEKSEAVQSEYVINIQCCEKIENHLRLLLMQYLGNDDQLMHRALSSSEADNPSVALILLPSSLLKSSTSGNRIT